MTLMNSLAAHVAAAASLLLFSQGPHHGAEASTPSETAAAVHPVVWKLLEQPGGAVKVWVLFRDKGIATPASEQAARAAARESLSARALHRRALRGRSPDLIDSRDIRLHEPYLDAVSAIAPIAQRSRWLNAVSVRADRNDIARITKLPCVARIQPVARSMPLRSARAGPGDPPCQPPEFYGEALNQLDLIRITDLQDAGVAGEGIIIGVLDTGFQRSHEAFNQPDHEIDVIAEWDFVDNDGDTSFEPGDPVIKGPFGPLYQHAHGTMVLAAIAAYMPCQLVGGAHGASFILAKTEDISQEVPAEEDAYVAGLEFIESTGADVATSSLGYISFYEYEDLDGMTAVTTIAVNIATEKGLVCVTAAGNGGQDQDLPTLIPPGDAFDVITVGAVTPSGDLADISSIGPTADGRIKPEVLAQGDLVATIDPIVDDAYTTQNGTSMSTPLVASASALLLQQHPSWTVGQVRAALLETSSIFIATGEPDPTSLEGYGIIDALAASEFKFRSPADLNGDGVVDAADLADLLAQWGPCPADGECAADIAPSSGGGGGGDGMIDAADLAELLANWS
jgi:subtilisin family serine protease